jgi:hypothetical protein
MSFDEIMQKHLNQLLLKMMEEEDLKLEQELAVLAAQAIIDDKD